MPTLIVIGIVVVTVAVIRGTSDVPSGPAGLIPDGVTPPPQVDAAIDASLGSACVSADAAETTLRAKLDEAGLEDWRITRDAASDVTGCVTDLVLVSERRIHLKPGLSPKVRTALEKLAGDMLDTCLTQTEAIDLVTSVLKSVGESQYELRTDGPRGGPADRTEEIKARIAAGCYLYGGVGWKPDGTRVYMIGGSLQ